MPNSCLVLAVERAPVGLAWFRDFYGLAGSCYLEEVCVLPELRGRGIGRELVAECIDWAAESGWVEMRVTPLAARGLWFLSQGFEMEDPGTLVRRIAPVPNREASKSQRRGDP